MRPLNIHLWFPAYRLYPPALDHNNVFVSGFVIRWYLFHLEILR